MGNICFFQFNALTLLSIKRSLKHCPHQSRLGYSSNNYEMPSKASSSMAGLDPSGCLLRPEDYKDADALKSCIYRSFIHHPLMWLLIDRADATAPALVVLCLDVLLANCGIIYCFLHFWCDKLRKRPKKCTFRRLSGLFWLFFVR